LVVNTDKKQLGKYRRIGGLDPKKGPVNGNDPLKLTDIRRSKFFGQAPYFEEIAKVEQVTYTVEFTVPREHYEQRELNLTSPIKLRGWFIKGKGVPNANGKKNHALVIFFVEVAISFVQSAIRPLLSVSTISKPNSIKVFPVLVKSPRVNTFQRSFIGNISTSSIKPDLMC
jgi:hypothetical protein